MDALIEKKQRQIELLQEKRAALVSHLVTKGLDPMVKTKDSGVKWFGAIPQHWKVTKLKFECERVFVGIAEAATFAYVDSGVPMLRSTDVRANRIRTDDIRTIAPQFAAQLKSKQLRRGDIVTVRTGNAGVSAVVPPHYDGGQCFTLVVSRPLNRNNAQYLSYLLNTTNVQHQFTIEGMGTAQINISVPIVQNAVICVPPLEEQSKIVACIDNDTRRLEHLINRIEHSVQYLIELRTALISAALTGKIDVRNEAA